MDRIQECYKRYVSGDEQALAEIICEYRGSLTLFIYRYVKNETVAEDIAIDVFSELVFNKHRYNYSVTLKTYLFTIARNRALSFLRRSRVIEFCELTGNEPDFSRTPESSLLEKERAKILYEALEKLPKDMMEAVYLVYFENLTYEQAAKVLKKNKKQVDNLIYRAKNKLYEILGNEGRELI